MNNPMRRDNFLPDDGSLRVTADSTSGRPGTRFALLTVLLSLVYLAAVQLTIGLRPDHIILLTLFDVGLLAHPASARLMRAMAIFLVFGMIYDGLKLVPNHHVGPVDIEGLYELELQLFGIMDGGTLRTPTEYLASRTSAPLDLVTGLIYLNWIPVPIAFGLYLYAVNKRRFIHFSFAFLLANILGFLGYYIHPAAPPWYVEEYGFIFRSDITGSAAGFLRFDAMVGVDIFQTIFTRNSNVFAAIPSLHSANPVVVLWYAALQLRHKHRTLYYAAFMVGMWYAAVYSGHHYVIDVILGVAVAVLGILLFELLLLRIPLFQRWLARYERSIS